MKNLPSPSKKVIKRLSNNEKHSIIESIIQRDEFKSFSTHREQCYYIYTEAKKLPDGNKPKITKEDIAFIYDEEIHTVKYHIKRGQEQMNGMIGRNGRPFCLTDEQITLCNTWIESHTNPPKYMSLIDYVQREFGKTMDYNSLHILLTKLGYEAVDAKPMEESRYQAKVSDIDKFFDDITHFTQENKIPPFMAFNLDEEGNDEFVDAKQIKIIVKKKEEGVKKQYFYPVKRKPNHTTFLGCVNAAGSYIKPLIVVKRVTIERSLLLHNYGPDRVLLGQSPKGYITKELYNKWLIEVFEPSVIKIRNEYGYYGPGLIIADGCTSHQTPLFNEVCERLNLRIFWLPPHSSNQLQVLDLGVFGVHKGLIKKCRINEIENESDIVQIIVKIMNSWCSVCTPTNIQSAWRAMGAVYSLNDNDNTVILTFKKEFAIKLLGRELSIAQRNANFETMISSERRRISIEEFNEFYKLPYPKLYEGIVLSHTDVEEESEEDNDEVEVDEVDISFDDQQHQREDVDTLHFITSSIRELMLTHLSMSNNIREKMLTHLSMINNISMLIMTLHFIMNNISMFIMTLHFIMSSISMLIMTLHFIMNNINMFIMTLHFITNSIREKIWTLHFIMSNINMFIMTLHFIMNSISMFIKTLHFIMSNINMFIMTLHFIMNIISMFIMTLRFIMNITRELMLTHLSMINNIIENVFREKMLRLHFIMNSTIELTLTLYIIMNTIKLILIHLLMIRKIIFWNYS